MDKAKLQIKVTLKGDDARKFRELKKRLGVLHDSEVIRVCLHDCYVEQPKEAQE